MSLRRSSTWHELQRCAALVAQLVCGVQARGDVRHDLRRDASVERRLFGAGGQDVVERVAIDPLHAEREHAPMLDELEDFAHVGVVDARRDARLVQEHAVEIRRRQLRQDRLERHEPAEAARAVLARCPHARHAAARDA
jgi:hypothetical protein